MEGVEDSMASASRVDGEASQDMANVAVTTPIPGVITDEEHNIQRGEGPQDVPPLTTPAMDEEDKYEFLSYSNYFFLEEQNYVNTYFDVKNVLKNTNPTLASFFKYISLLSHVIYFDQVEEKKILTSIDVQSVTHILLKNEQSNINSYTVAYSCIVLLLDVIKLSPHAGLKNYVYCQLAKNAQKIENLFFPIYSFQKGKHRDHSYVVRKNEAIFISDFVTLNVINLLNGEDKLNRTYGLQLCLLFCQHFSGCNHLVNMILRVIFKKINYDEFALALLVLTRWTPFLSHDVLYHVVRGLYHSAMGRSITRREIPTVGKQTTSAPTNREDRPAGDTQTHTGRCTDEDVSQAKKQSHTEKKKQSPGEVKKGPILDNPFTFTLIMYLSKIANRMNHMVPYVSYFLFRKLWKTINSLFSEEENLCTSEEAAMTILRAYFHSTTLLSNQNEFLKNLHIISIKFLLMIPQTELMKRRHLTYFALKSLLFFIKKKNIHVLPFGEDLSGRTNTFQQRVSSFHFAYFSFVSTVREYELVDWLNCLPLCRGDSPALFMFVKILYQFFKAANGDNYLNGSGEKRGSISQHLPNHCKEENAGEVSTPGSHPNHSQMNFLPVLSRAHHDPFIQNFVCTMRDSLPVEMLNPDDCPKGEHKFTPDYAMGGEEHLPLGTGGNELSSPSHKEISFQREEKKRSSCENDVDRENKGQFCFTITLSDSDRSVDSDAEEEHFAQESMPNVANMEGPNRKQRMDLFFEKFVQLAKESEQASDINVKNLDITLKIRGRGTPKGEQHHQQEQQQEQQLKEDPEAEQEIHPGNERADHVKEEPAKRHHPRRESNAPPKREDGTLLNSRQPTTPYFEDEGEDDSGKSSLSDAISEISNDQHSLPKKKTMKDSLYTPVKTDKRGKLRKEKIFLYCYKWLMKNKIKLHSFVCRDKLKYLTSEEHSIDSVSTKLCILKTLTILGKYIVCDEDVRDFLNLFNSFFHFCMNNKEDANVDTSAEGVENSPTIGETYHTSKNVYDVGRGAHMGRSKYTHSGTHLDRADRLHTVRGIGETIASSDVEPRDETNFDLFLTDLLQNRLNDPSAGSNNDPSYQQSGAFKSAMQTCLLSITANLGNHTNEHLLNCLFQSFCSNEFVPFFHLLFALRAEKIVHILKDPFFYLLIDGQELEGDYSPRGKGNDEYGMSSNQLTEEEKKKTSLDTLVSRAKGDGRVYFLKTSKFLQTFNICQREDDHPASYHNMRHLFHLSLVSYGKGEEVSTALRKKVNLVGDGNQLWGKEKAAARGYSGDGSNRNSVDGSGDSSNNSDSCDGNRSSDTPPSTYASSDGQPSSADCDQQSDCSSISSMSNKSLRRKVQNIYKKLQYQERVPSEENVQVANLKKNESSLFYLYRSGKYCMCAGFYKHGYAIFGKLFVLANSGDIRLWFRALSNYCNFFCQKRNKLYGDWKTFLSPIKYLLISEQCMKEVRIFQENFFLYGFFVKVQMNMYRAVEDLLTLVGDIRDEINFTLTYFVCNIERIITSLVETTLGILTLAGIRHLFAGLSKRVLFLYVVFLKSTFVLCSFLRHKVIPFLFLSPSCVVRAPPVDSGEDSNGSSSGGRSDEGCVERRGKRIGGHRAVFNIGSCTLHDLVHFYLNKRKIKRMRKNIFAKEVTNTQGKNFPDVFDYVMTLWKVAASKFFFYEHVQKIKELYNQFFKDGMVNKKKVLAFMKVYLEVVYRMDLPTPPRVFSSVAVPYVASSTYVYRSIKGRAPCEVESLKCVGQLVSRKVAAVRDFHSCNVKLVLKNKVIREANVRSQGMNVTYTAHIKMGEDEWKDFTIFLTPLDRKKRLLGQAKATVFYFKYV
ncbi:Uncharacterized protein PCOAH_00001510 [Plasmodium coatneyi]|uniref:Uncharacterized protein n=1 Tax=Plasmodium coatneyi TaxID=208452 RepID=A0A1B1DSY5_9APIC|nr:Uncharacterized protein PCOAH_00001510 [Plasmodium coatneyi]ANQ05717.1 Uncharacterized protein PCOAH_00001510 [Plasmodium coatneyi]